MKIQTWRPANPVSVVCDPPTGPAGLCKTAGSGSLSPASLPVQEEARGDGGAADSDQRIPRQEGVEAQERRCDPAAGLHQGRAGQEGSEEDEERCESKLKNNNSESFESGVPAL